MDSLLQAIVDAPDDDGPRLVWADREGGERGELVVLQCQIAARVGSRADRVRMQDRVRELLVPKDDDDDRGKRTFARGFVETAQVKLDAVGPALFEEMPLLRELEIDDFMPGVRPSSYEEATPEEAWAYGAQKFAAAFASMPPDRLRELEVTAEVKERGDYAYPDDEHPFGDAFVALIASTPALAGLRELRVIGGGMTGAVAPHVARLGLTALHGGSCFDAAGAIALLEAVPALRSFGAWNGKPPLAGDELGALLAAPATRGLVELDLWANNLYDSDLSWQLARAPFTALERLCIGMGEFTDIGVADLAASPHLAGLVDLNLYSFRATPSPAPFCRAPFALTHLRLSTVDDAIMEALLAAPALERIHVDTITPEQLARLRAVIPLVNDGLW